MKIHEYQAKELFARYNIPIQRQKVVENVSDVVAAVESLEFPIVLKAQVLAGGRGKAGGVLLANSADEAIEAAKKIFGLTIKGFPVKKLLLSHAVEIQQEYYLGITLDRGSRQMVLLISAEGGVDIEQLAVERPDAIARLKIDPINGLQKQELNQFFTRFFPDEALCRQAVDTAIKLYALTSDLDCSLIEINPYAIVDDETLLALDAKINFDDNALYRRSELEKLKNSEEYSADEIDAKAHELSFVSMEGTIGCIVNGAGLAMATMDLIKLFDGEAANFLDVGGSSNPQKVFHALRIITNNPNVSVILINIFGGITRCDDIAKGITLAFDKIDITIPIVIRLIGTNEEAGRAILQQAGFEVVDDLSTAVQKSVSLAKASV